jgi:hypothetical protein
VGKGKDSEMMLKGETKVAALVAGPARGPSSRYWLIAKDEYGWMEVLTIDLDGQEAMPVFSFREEAEMYIRFEAWDGWSVREIAAGELTSLFFGPYSCVEKVALDPLPEICDEGMTRLVSVSRKDFARMLSRDRGIRITLAPGSTAHRPSRAQRRR